MTPRTKLLYIESSNQIQGWVMNLLNDLDCDTTQALTNTAARAAIEKETPLNVVLLGDLTRPTGQLSGVPTTELSIIKLIRDRKAYEQTTIIVFSSADYAKEALQNGANDFLAKPAGAVELKRILIPHLTLSPQSAGS